MSFIHSWVSAIKRFVRHSPRRSIAIAAAAIVMIAVGVHYARGTQSATQDTAQVGHVTLASVASLSSQTAALPVTGSVQSLHQATILSQSAGEVVEVDHKLGDTISAGAVIARFDSASQQASVLQAEGALDAAKANLEKTTGTNAQNTGINSSSAATAAVNAQNSVGVALASLYAALDDAIHTKTDTMLSNPRTSNPILSFSTSDSQLTIDVQNQRTQLDALIESVHAQVIAYTTATDADAAAAAGTANATQAIMYLNDMITALNKSMPTQNVSAATLSGYQATASAARTELVAALSALSSAKTAYDGAKGQAQVAANTADSGFQNDVATAQASVKQARGALAAAQAQLEKTVIRSPISGTLVSFSLKRGDYVNTYAQVAIVSNAGALEVVTHVTSDDAKTLAVGGAVTIEGGASGVITSIAPAIDPTTNKIEVHVGITNGSDSLTDGENVVVTFARGESKKAAGANTQITIPIVAVKIEPSGPVVFSVNASSTLEAHAITLGAILGDTVAITNGLTPDMTIISDARGKSAGDAVIVDSQ